MLQDNLLPPSQRCSYDCEKEPTGPLDRKKLIDHINKQALETPDIPEAKPYVAGVIRGRKVSFLSLFPLEHRDFQSLKADFQLSPFIVSRELN